MKRVVSVLVIVVLLAGLLGCQGNLGSKSDMASAADIQLHCVVKFLTSDGSWYLTEQRHQIYRSAKAGRFTADEPSGRISWLLTDGDVVIVKRPKGVFFNDEIVSFMTSKEISSGLLELCFAEKAGVQAQKGSAEDLVFEGRIYRSVPANQKGVGLYYSDSTGRSDLVIVQGQKRYILCGYNYLKLDDDSYIPSKIDVYTQEIGEDRKLLAQYSCQLD